MEENMFRSFEWIQNCDQFAESGRVYTPILKSCLYLIIPKNGVDAFLERAVASKPMNAYAEIPEMKRNVGFEI